jgi:hypothetical protein
MALLCSPWTRRAAFSFITLALLLSIMADTMAAEHSKRSGRGKRLTPKVREQLKKWSMEKPIPNHGKCVIVDNKHAEKAPQPARLEKVHWIHFPKGRCECVGEREG